MLTREKVLEMKPGRELDALVMRNIFKAEKKDIGDDWYWCIEVDCVCECWPRWFSPSTDISAAWEVEAAAMEIDRLEYVAALMQVVWNDMNYIELADPDNMTAWQAIPDLLRATPEQRCKAALLAVIGEDEHERD